jgi:uncharacterized GH25 family protein
LKKHSYSRRISIIFAAFFVLFFSANIAGACTCMSPSLDEAIDGAANIVILKLQSVEKYREGETGYGVDGIKQSRLTVEKIFKGNFKVGQELIFAQGGGADCVWTFHEERIGTEYLFFLDSKPDKKNIWEGFICSRSSSVKGAAGDLMYLETMSKVKGKTRLSGSVTQKDNPAPEDETGSYQRLAGRTVIISGNSKNIKLKTDENGIYEIYDLPPGKYQVTPEKVSGYKFEDDDDKGSVEVEIQPKGLSEQDFEFKIDNSISGKFLDSYGKPLKGVSLDLIPARGNLPPRSYARDFTNADGTFEFEEIPIGTYLIVVNRENEISAGQPFGTFYYPNKINREEAAVITIGAGDHFKNLIITAPTTAETITVSGVLLFEDGKPVFNEFIDFFQNFEDPSKIEKYKPADSRVMTDENGRFSIRILKGQKGILFGWMSTYEGKYEKCPKMDALIKADKSGSWSTDVKTQAIPINADHDIEGVELKFSFPKCKRAKIE